MEMLGKGYADVVIVDLAENGKAYAPAKFREFYLDTRKNTALYEARPSRPIIAKLPERSI
jgi:hypothetical protein